MLYSNAVCCGEVSRYNLTCGTGIMFGNSRYKFIGIEVVLGPVPLSWKLTSELHFLQEMSISSVLCYLLQLQILASKLKPQLIT